MNVSSIDCYPVSSSVLGFGMNTIGDDLNLAINTQSKLLSVIVYANASFWCSYPSKSFQQRRGIAGEVQRAGICFNQFERWR